MLILRDRVGHGERERAPAFATEKRREQHAHDGSPGAPELPNLIRGCSARYFTHMFECAIRPILAKSKKSLLLLGPRQVGKSTLLRSLGPDRVIDLALPSEYRTYLGHPDTLERELSAAEPGHRTILIDEVRKVTELLDVAQAFLDRAPRRFRFLLSGSSARKPGRSRPRPGEASRRLLREPPGGSGSRSPELCRRVPSGRGPGRIWGSGMRSFDAPWTDLWTMNEGFCSST